MKHLALLLLLIIGLGAYPAFHHSKDQEASWRITLSFSVSGSYAIDLENQNTQGTFSFQTVNISHMEYDGDGDYIFYFGKSRTKSFKWNETSPKKDIPGHDSPPPGEMNPSLNITCVIKEGGLVRFDFNFPPLWTQHETSGSKKRIILPCSYIHEQIHGRIRYNRYVTDGTNKIDIEEKELYQKPLVRKTFTWDWEKQTPSLSSEHRVTLEISLAKATR